MQPHAGNWPGTGTAGTRSVPPGLRNWLASRYTLITVSGARTSLSGWLARMGFADVPRAERELAALGITSEGHPVLAAAAQAADPDLALASLAQIAERDPSVLKALSADAALRGRLTAVLGVSKAMADHLIRHPGDLAVLRGPEAVRRLEAKAIREEFLRAVAADPDDSEPVAGQASAPAARQAAASGRGAVPAVPDPAGRLAAAYHRRLLQLAEIGRAHV